ncbi:transposable element Tcb1 transposase [Trichonephila clavipes]|nr:transposable element Tcb1 transposase [Trichonephila clavipes]
MSVHHDHSETADRGQFTLLPTTMPPATHACILCSHIIELVKHFLGQPDLSPIDHIWYVMGRRLNLPENVDDQPRESEQIWHEIPLETIRVLYHFMPRRVAACIQARCGLKP